MAKKRTPSNTRRGKAPKSGKSYELASAYVTIMPSLSGVKEEIQDQIESAMPGSRDIIGKGIVGGFNKALAQGSEGFSGGLIKVSDTIGNKIFSTLGNTFKKAGGLLSSTLTAGVGIATSTIGAGMAAVIGKAASGGLTRALNLNQANASLDALGYSASQVESIMDSVGKAIDGTSAGMGEAVGTATQLLSAGITDYDELEQTLRNVSKLSDISGTSFADMGTIFAKNAASGKIQYADLVQLMNHQIPIMSELSKSMNKPVEEIRSMASAGEITFKDFQDAIEKIDFDSAVYAARNTRLAFNNVLSGLGKIGAKFWQPIVDGMGPAFGTIRQGLIDLQNNKTYINFSDNIVSKLQENMEKVNKVLSGIGGKIADKSTFADILEKWLEKIDKFKKSIEGLEGVMGGVGLSLASGLLSKIPIIGGLFGGITLGVGAFGGALVQAYKDSDRLQTSIETLGNVIKVSAGKIDLSNILDTKILGDKIGDIVYSITNLFNNIDIDISGFSLNPLIDFITTQIKGFIDALAHNGAEISDILADIGNLFSTIFETLSADNGNTMKALAENLVTAMGAIVPVLEIIMQLSSSFLQTVASVASSKIGQGVIGGVIKILEVIADSKVAILVGGALATIFMFKKLITPIIALGKFLPAIMASFKSLPALGKLITAGVKSVIQGMAAAGKAAITGAAHLAAFGVLVLAIGGIVFLLDKMNFFEILHNFTMNFIEAFAAAITVALEVVSSIVNEVIKLITAVAEAIVTIWPTIESYLLIVKDGIVEIAEVIGDSIVRYAEAITEGIAAIIDAISGGMALVIDTVSSLISTLSAEGLTAGAGALAAATGITALAGALVLLTGGSLIQSIGNFATGAIDGLADLFGFNSSQFSGLTEAAEILTDFNEKVVGMPANWAIVGSTAYSSGQLIMASFGDGLVSGLSTVEQRITAEITAMMSRIQSTVSSTPVNLRVNGSATSGGSNSYTTNNNYSIRTSNDSIARSLINAARGSRRY